MPEQEDPRKVQEQREKERKNREEEEKRKAAPKKDAKKKGARGENEKEEPKLDKKTEKELDDMLEQYEGDTEATAVEAYPQKDCE